MNTVLKIATPAERRNEKCVEKAKVLLAMAESGEIEAFIAVVDYPSGNWGLIATGNDQGRKELGSVMMAVHQIQLDLMRETSE